MTRSRPYSHICVHCRRRVRRWVSSTPRPLSSPRRSRCDRDFLQHCSPECTCYYAAMSTLCSAGVTGSDSLKHRTPKCADMSRPQAANARAYAQAQLALGSIDVATSDAAVSLMGHHLPARHLEQTKSRRNHSCECNSAGRTGRTTTVATDRTPYSTGCSWDRRRRWPGAGWGRRGAGGRPRSHRRAAAAADRRRRTRWSV